MEEEITMNSKKMLSIIGALTLAAAAFVFVGCGQPVNNDDGVGGGALHLVHLAPLAAEPIRTVVDLAALLK